MLTERLNASPLSGLLVSHPRWPVPSSSDRAAWSAVSAPARGLILAEAERLRAVPWPMRRATDFLAFVRTGSRKADEDPYFLRRRKLCVAAMACCLGDETFLDEVTDGLWCVCEETSWVISAHNVNPIPGAPSAAEYPLPDPDRPYVDLFAAQTAMILAWIDHLLGEKLDAVHPLLRQRLRRETERRVLAPFMETDEFWWMGFRRSDLCNWTPWIVSSVFMAACLLPRPLSALSALLERGCGMLDRWLDCVPEDGGCDEGAGYWNMAGGALLDCLETLETATGGRFTLWDDAKLRAILTYPVKAHLGGGWFVNFADCDARPQLSGERLLFAGERLGDPSLAALGRMFGGGPLSALSDVPHFSRALRCLFHSPADPGDGGVPAPDDVWLPDLQLRTVRRGGFTLACKGGHNGESHNHNDAGSFILMLDGEPALVDAGNMTYTAKTFSSERYTLWNTRSAYHNVPLIGDAEQRPGRDYAARDVRCLPDGLSLDLAGAYPPECGLRCLRRELRLTADGLTLTDRVSLERETSVTWVLMLRHAPAVSGRTLTAGGLRLSWPEGLSCRAEEIPVTDPRMAANYPGSLWRVCLTAEAFANRCVTIEAGRADS